MTRSTTRRTAWLAAALTSALAGAAAFVACGPKDFPDEDLINTVRILASRSDQPFAKPGATVRSEVLAVDARPDASGNEPMHIYWLPFVCVNPAGDAYYACFQAFYQNASAARTAANDSDGGAQIIPTISAWNGAPDASVGLTLPVGDAGAAGQVSLMSIPAGTDISPYLVQGPKAVFRLPTTIVSSHPQVNGAPDPYGLAIVFNIACGGHIEVVPLDPNNPDPVQIPFGCFNAAHQQLTPSDYVIGYTEVFAYETLTNQNPIISSFAFRDAGVPLDGGDAGDANGSVAFPHCTDSNTNDCPNNYAVTGVPDASWELDPQTTGDGGPLHEEIWVDYFATIGSLSQEAVLVFDPVLGRIAPSTKNEQNLQSVTSKQRGTLWAVAHDNRGGTSWITVKLNAQ